jgi:hypothetical protein
MGAMANEGLCECAHRVLKLACAITDLAGNEGIEV